MVPKMVEHAMIIAEKVQYVSCQCRSMSKRIEICCKIYLYWEVNIFLAISFNTVSFNM